MNTTPFLNLFASSPWMPERASSVSSSVDFIFDFIVYLCAFFFVLVIGVMISFIIKYRKKSPDQKTSPIEDNTRLEIIWTLIPTVILFLLFYWGMQTWMDISVPPANSIEIRVEAGQWDWSFSYPRHNVYKQGQLVVPVNKNIKLIMHSRDVIHSFFVPEFRIKRDVLPKRYSVTWFRATKKGIFHVFCTEYCGAAAVKRDKSGKPVDMSKAKGHSTMLTTVRVVSEVEYKAWLKKKAKEGVSGKKLYNTYCVACHSLNGSRMTGPSFKDLYGRKEEVIDKEKGGAIRKILVDDSYVRKSIFYPQAHIVKGYPGVMSTYKGTLGESDIIKLIEFLKKNSKHAK